MLVLVVAGMLLCALLLMRLHQRDILLQQNACASDLRESRADLSQGLLQVMVGGEAGFGFDRDRGVALIAQSLDIMLELEQRLERPLVTQDSRPLQEVIGEMREQCQRLRGEAPPSLEQAVRLQVICHELHTLGERMNRELDREMEQINRRQNQNFIFTVLGSVLFLALLAYIAFRADRELVQNEARLLLFVEHAPAALAMFDLRMCYLAASKRWQRDYGLGTGSVIGRCHYDLFPSLPEPWKEVHRRGFAGEIVRAEEDRFVHPDGVVQWLRWEVHPWVQPNGKVGGIVIFAEDITSIKEAQAEVQRLNAQLEQRVQERTAELQAANKEIESFSYSVSHDLRAPLRAIDGFGRIIAESYGSLMDAQGKDYLRRVLAATERMGQLIDDLLELSRINRVELQRRPVDLVPLARNCLELHMHAEPARKVRIVLPPGLTVYGDSRLLTVLLENLLNNAWKFTSRTEEAVIELGLSEAGPDRCGGFVRDNGAGFDMAYAAKLFTPFQRLHHQNEFPGTGIGLATVNRIVLRHGGRVWAEGMPGAGATIHFEFPRPVPNPIPST